MGGRYRSLVYTSALQENHINWWRLEKRVKRLLKTEEYECIEDEE